jgi:hypothetical protein
MRKTNVRRRRRKIIRRGGQEEKNMEGQGRVNEKDK